MIQVLWRMLINVFEQRWKPGQSMDGLQIISYVGSGSYGSTYSVRLPDGDPAIL
ncbi:hypothetical protein [Bacillus sp. KH172YL63]|uniref:hypothetical protein n=1 Tax=Bacillus sp. KH172YL63 TaxID=2709784 RepID=UPI001566120A|nr:hypothetical protein [Bacillus sp. KH172YL63]